MAWTLRLPDHLEERLESLSQSQARPKSRIVQEAVEEYLKTRDEEQKTWERLRSLPVLPGNPGILEAENPVFSGMSHQTAENVPPIPEKTEDRREPCVHAVPVGLVCVDCDGGVGH